MDHDAFKAHRPAPGWSLPARLRARREAEAEMSNKLYSSMPAYADDYRDTEDEMNANKLSLLGQQVAIRFLTNPKTIMQS